MAAPAARPGRATFGPVVLIGLAAATLAAVAGSKPWVDLPKVPGVPGLEESAKVPLAGALALLMLASWGVLLVTGPLVRRIVAVIAILAGLGVIACVVDSRDLSDRIDVAGVSSQQPTLNAWIWTALVAAVICVLASLAALRWAPAWPTMSSRYDAPAAESGDRAARPLDEIESSRELWDQINEGHDPTLGQRPLD